jgi:[acyl-carrier-protein] S-malonyltransferase
VAREHTPVDTVYMFPGLGAEYPGMVEAFRDRHAWAPPLLERWSDIVGCDLSAQDAGGPKERESLRQFRIHALNLLWWRAAGMEPGREFACCGHSLGFYAALVAAGALTEESSLRWLRTVFTAAWEEFSENRGKIAVITTTAAVDPHRLAGQFSVEVMAKNSARQIVVYGAEQDIARLCRSLEAILLRNSDLGTRLPFHSISMLSVCDRVAQVAGEAGLAVGQPTRPVWSHLTGELLSSAAAIRATLLEQPCRTVLWEKLMSNLQKHYHAEFVEIGPSRILSQLLRWNDADARVRYVDHLRTAAKPPARMPS